jgi:hypothetical protein
MHAQAVGLQAGNFSPDLPRPAQPCIDFSFHKIRLPELKPVTSSWLLS